MGSWSPDYKLNFAHSDIPLSERKLKKVKIERTKGLSKAELVNLEGHPYDFRIWIQVRFRFIVYAIYLFLIIRYEHNFYMFRNARYNNWYQSHFMLNY